MSTLGQHLCLIMVLAAKWPRRPFYSAEYVLKLLEDDENSNEGMSSDEESMLDHLLLDSEEDSREELCKHFCLCHCVVTRDPRTWSKMQGNDIFIGFLCLKLALLLGESVWIYI